MKYIEYLKDRLHSLAVHIAHLESMRDEAVRRCAAVWKEVDKAIEGIEDKKREEVETRKLYMEALRDPAKANQDAESMPDGPSPF